MKISENGIFQVGPNKYSKTYSFSDVNYATRTEDEQEGFFSRYCKVLNSFDCSFSITVNNKNKYMEKLREEILLDENKRDGFGSMRGSCNNVIEHNIVEGKQGIEQERYITISTERNNFEDAKSRFATIESNVLKSFATLGYSLEPLNGNERLKILHDFYRLVREEEFTFDIREGKKTGTDFINEICNSSLKFNKDYNEDEEYVRKVIYIKKYPTYLSDRFFTELTSLPVHSITTIDVVPVPKDITMKILQKKYLGIESEIIRQQRTHNRNNDFSSDISYNTRVQKMSVQKMMDDVRENDESLFFVGVTMVIMGEDKEELDSVMETVQTIARSSGCAIDTCDYRQREALNTTLPIGVRQIETMRTMLTQSLAVLMPINIQEVMR